MDNQSFYRIAQDRSNDIADLSAHLLVNCVGISVLDRPFTTWRPEGRRDYYLMVLVQGTLNITIAGAVHVMRVGHFVLWPPGCPTGYSKTDDSEMAYYWVHFTGNGAASLLADCRIGPGLHLAGASPSVTGLFHQLFEAFIYRDDCLEPAAAGLLTSLLVALSRSQNKWHAEPRPPTPERLSRSIDYLHQHSSRPVTLSCLAALEHLSVSRYSALFRRCMGQSPQSFLIDLRLRSAVALLHKTDLSIKQIASMVGYEDPLYFSRLFRSRLGVSPRLYQQRNHPLKRFRSSQFSEPATGLNPLAFSQ